MKHGYRGNTLPGMMNNLGEGQGRKEGREGREVYQHSRPCILGPNRETRRLPDFPHHAAAQGATELGIFTSWHQKINNSELPFHLLAKSQFCLWFIHNAVRTGDILIALADDYCPTLSLPARRAFLSPRNAKLQEETEYSSLSRDL